MGCLKKYLLLADRPFSSRRVICIFRNPNKSIASVTTSKPKTKNTGQTNLEPQRTVELLSGGTKSSIRNIAVKKLEACHALCANDAPKHRVVNAFIHSPHHFLALHRRIFRAGRGYDLALSLSLSSLMHNRRVSLFELCSVVVGCCIWLHRRREGGGSPLASSLREARSPARGEPGGEPSASASSGPFTLSRSLGSAVGQCQSSFRFRRCNK